MRPVSFVLPSPIGGPWQSKTLPYSTTKQIPGLNYSTCHAFYLQVLKECTHDPFSLITWDPAAKLTLLETGEKSGLPERCEHPTLS